MIRPKNQTWLKAVKKLDAVFSQWVRRSNADEFGMAHCVTCNARKHYKELHAGHCFSRKKFSVRFSEMNVFPQCPRCNLYGQGEQLLFTRFLDSKFGEGTAERLLIESNQMRKYSVEELREMIEDYTQRLKDCVVS